MCNLLVTHHFSGLSPSPFFPEGLKNYTKSPFLFASKFIPLPMQIGIISDTHNILPKSVLKHFKNVDYIFHAGDIGDLKILDELKEIAPVYAVHGNIDNGETRKKIPAMHCDEIEGFEICLIHDIGSVKNFSYELFKNGNKADLVIFGHMHRPIYEIFQKTTFINPGSASYPRNQKYGTIAIVNFEGKSFSHHFIDLEDS